MILWILKHISSVLITNDSVRYKFDPMDFETISLSFFSPKCLGINLILWILKPLFAKVENKSTESINLILWILKHFADAVAVHNNAQSINLILWILKRYEFTKKSSNVLSINLILWILKRLPDLRGRFIRGFSGINLILWILKLMLLIFSSSKLKYKFDPMDFETVYFSESDNKTKIV